MSAKGFQLGGKEQGSAEPSVVERFFAHAVARQPEHPLTAVPGGDGEHAFQPRQRRLDAPAIEGRQDRLRVGVPAEFRRPAGAALQLIAEGKVVVDLAIEGDHEASGGRAHGLMPGRRKVENGQPPVSQGDSALRLRPRSVVVRPAMGQPVRHGSRQPVHLVRGPNVVSLEDIPQCHTFSTSPREQHAERCRITGSHSMRSPHSVLLDDPQPGRSSLLQRIVLPNPGGGVAAQLASQPRRDDQLLQGLEPLSADWRPDSLPCPRGRSRSWLPPESPPRAVRRPCTG